jgi:hypothetical protein
MLQKDTYFEKTEIKGEPAATPRDGAAPDRPRVGEDTPASFGKTKKDSPATSRKEGGGGGGGGAPDRPWVGERTSPAEPGDEAKRAVAKALERTKTKLGTGNIAYNAPKSMQLGETVPITLRLSKTATIPELKARITEPGEKLGATIRVSEKMRAILTGPPSAFDITPSFDPQMPQELSDDGVNEWTWDVTAKSPGTYRLHLVIFAEVEAAGERAAGELRTFDEPLLVNVTFGQRLAGFVGSNWQWLWTVIVAPAAVVIATRWRKRRKGSWFADRLSRYSWGSSGGESGKGLTG